MIDQSLATEIDVSIVFNEEKWRLQTASDIFSLLINIQDYAKWVEKEKITPDECTRLISIFKSRTPILQNAYFKQEMEWVASNTTYSDELRHKRWDKEANLGFLTQDQADIIWRAARARIAAVGKQI